MKKQTLSYLFILLSVLFITPVSGQKNKQKLPIAYINIDYILSNYTYAIELNESLKRKTILSKSLISDKRTDYDRQIKEFQQKIEQNAFSSSDRANQEYENIKKMSEDLVQLENNQKDELKAEQSRINTLLEEAIVNEIKEYNKDKKYHLIYSNKGGLSNILYANEEYNITDNFLTFINGRYPNPNLESQ